MEKKEFDLKGMPFKAGYYTLECFYGRPMRPVYILAYSKAFAKNNPHKLNNSCLVLEKFDALPDGAIVYEA